ncbi:MAG: TonB-dependent receptor, partial [Muribaculaceae bacterium]|nr:TonB-dependent receptor [Muribaculaceae bacterium]
YYIVWGLNSNSMKLYKDEYFSGRVNPTNYAGNCVDGAGMVNSLGNSQPGNPYHQLYEATNAINKDRVYGTMTLTINLPVKGLSLDLRGGTDISVDFRQQKKPFYSPGYKSGFYREQNNRDSETNLDFMLKYNNSKLFNKRLGLNAAFGGNNMSRRVYRAQITLDKLGEPGVYNAFNSPTGENPRPYEWRSKKVVNSFYGFISASWDETYFLDLTARNDWSSTLGKGNWSFFYPSVSASVLLDKVFNFQENTPQVNMLKLRASWANVGNDTSPYQLSDAYSASSTYPGGYTYPTNRSNYYIRPENVESWEAGIETMFFMNRIGLDIAYYDSSTTNQIVDAVTDLMTGASSKKMNCGEIRNRGIEIALHAVPVRTRHFTWSIDVNWSRNWNKLVSLEDGWDPRTPYEQTKNLMGNYGRVLSYLGEEMNIIYGRGYQRAPEGATYVDADGNTVSCAGMKLIDASTGYPILTTEQKRLGKVNPTWRGGLSTTLRYRDFTLGLNFTAQMGGHTYSMTNAILGYQGKLENSLPGRNDGLVVTGVNVSTDANGNTVYTPNTTPTEMINKYYTTFLARDNAEENTFKTDFLKLKEMRLDYTLPRSICRKLRVLQGASIGAYATNLFCITNFPQYDPEAGTIVGTNIYSGIEIGALPMTRTYGVNLKLSF